MKSLALTSTIAFLSIFMANTAVADEIPPCTTNTDTDGTVFGGFFATVDPQVTFETVTTDNAQISIFASVRLGTAVIVHGGTYRGPYSAEGAANDPAAGGDAAIFTFRNETGAPVHECKINVMPFDPTTWAIEDTGLGDCASSILEGPDTLTVGSTQLVQVNGSHTETAAAPSAVIGMLTTSAETFELHGISSGHGHYLWTGDDTGNGTLRGLCPVTVTR